MWNYFRDFDEESRIHASISTTVQNVLGQYRIPSEDFDSICEVAKTRVLPHLSRCADEINHILQDSLKGYITENSIKLIGDPIPDIEKSSEINWKRKP